MSSSSVQAGVSVSGGDVLFSKERIESTLVSGYFELLGEMTKSSAGLAFVFPFNTPFFSKLTYPSVQSTRSMQDVHLFLSNQRTAKQGRSSQADYRKSRLFERWSSSSVSSQGAHFELQGALGVLSLSSAHEILTERLDRAQHIRLFATNHLASLIRQSSSSHKSQCSEWQIDLLVPQLYDPSPEVTQLAISILSQACTNERTLEMVVRKRPEVEHLGEGAVELLTQ